MSSVQSYSNSQSFNGKVGSWTYKNFDKNSLYPNSTAKPYKADFSISIWRDWYIVSQTVRGKIVYNGTEKCSINQDASKSTKTDSTSSTGGEVTGYNQGNATIQLGYYGSSSLMSINVSGTVTNYFYRYDFSATAESGVTSASVSSKTGYGGADITFSCVIPTGYVFDGWYKAGAQTPYSTDQSFTYTIPTDNAANYDLKLTAMAHQETHSLIGTYNGSTKAIETGLRGDASIACYSPDDQRHEAILNTSNPTFTLSCANKMIYGSIICTTTYLSTHGKIMRSDLVLNYV